MIKMECVECVYLKECKHAANAIMKACGLFFFISLSKCRSPETKHSNLLTEKTAVVNVLEISKDILYLGSNRIGFLALK